MAQKVLLDTNFLMVPFQFSVDIFSELDRILGSTYKIYVLDVCLEEAKHLQKGRYRALVEKLIEIKGIDILNSKLSTEKTARARKDVDTLLLEYAHRSYLVCTNDRALRKRLKKEHLPSIYLRQKSHLEMG